MLDDGRPAGRWRALAVLALAMVLAMTTWFSASAVLPQLSQRWTLRPGETALLTISVQLGFVVGALASATLGLADRLNPRRLILLGTLGATLANGLIALDPGWAAALALRGATGACLALVYPPALKAMATWFRAERGTALGVMVGALTLGSALPHLVNGLGGLDWRFVILATSILTLAGGLVAEFLGRDGPYPFPRAPFELGQAARAFANPGVRLATLGYFGHMWELYAMWAWFAAYYAHTLRQAGVLDPARGAAFATFAVVGVGALGCWVGGLLGDRWGRARTSALAMLLSGCCAILAGLSTAAPPPFVLALGLVWGFWVIADSAQFSTLVSELIDQRFVGTAVTVQLAAGFSLTVVTIWLVPLLRDRFSWGWALAVLALGPMVGIGAMLPLLRSQGTARITGGRG